MTEFGEIDPLTSQMIQSFRNETLNKRHQAQQCPTCDEKIKSRFIHHTKLCRQFSPFIKKIGEKRYQCILCHRDYGKREDLYRHCRVKHPNPASENQEGNQAFGAESSAVAEIPHFFLQFIETKNEQFHCKLCNFVHFQEESMSLHLQKCHAESSQMWNMNLIIEANLKIGEKMETFLRNFTHRCPTCSEIITSGKMTHVKVCLKLSPFIRITDIRRYQCKICFVERGLRKDAFRHLYQKHNPEIEECYSALKENEKILKIFEMENNAGRSEAAFQPPPVIVEIKEEPQDSQEGAFACNFCSRRFSDISSIKIHLEISHAVPIHVKK